MTGRLAFDIVMHPDIPAFGKVEDRRWIMKMHRLSLILSVLLFITFCNSSCGKDYDMEFNDFLARHTALIEPLEREGSLAYWDAARSGNEEDFMRYSRAHMALEKIYTSREDFEYIKAVRKSGRLKDPDLRRAADLLYLKYIGNQVGPELLERIVDISSRIENRFNVFRAEVDGRALTTNEIYSILRENTDSDYRKKVWEASKKVGLEVAEDLLELVRARNESARAVGYDNYYSMSMSLGEQSEDQLVTIFSELDELTRDPYLAVKKQIDGELALMYGIDPKDIAPWHYHDPYFQELPATGSVNLAKYYSGRDIAELAALFYASIGMPVEDIISRSDLYERDGKNPHAFCTDIDRKGDVRILCNLVDNNYWMETMLHELGHGVYDKYIDRSLPFILRTYPHLCTTEASAMYFGRLSQDPHWMRSALGLSDEDVEEITPVVEGSLRMKQLIFARWVQVMFNFERELYRDPDQDLGKLWWDLKERFQFVRRPEGRDAPDYAAKIHIISSPVYYHNYMLGELIASQFHHHVVSEILTGSDGEGIYGNRAVGDFFREAVFRPGNVVPWDEHIRQATGEKLSARYFVQQFVKE